MNLLRNKRFCLGLLVLVLVFGMAVFGCELGSSKDSGDPTYSVRTAVMSYTDYTALGGSLGDRRWSGGELTVDEYNQYISMYNTSPQVTNKNQNNWTKDQIITYFVGRGFDYTMADQAASLVVTTSHIVIASRQGSRVDLLLK